MYFYLFICAAAFGRFFIACISIRHRKERKKTLCKQNAHTVCHCRFFQWCWCDEDFASKFHVYGTAKRMHIAPSKHSVFFALEPNAKHRRKKSNEGERIHTCPRTHRHVPVIWTKHSIIHCTDASSVCVRLCCFVLFFYSVLSFLLRRFFSLPPHSTHHILAVSQHVFVCVLAFAHIHTEP